APDPTRAPARPARHRRAHRVRWETRRRTRPLRIDLDTAVAVESIPQHSAVLGQGCGVSGVPELVEQPGRAVDVGEEERDGSTRQIDSGHETTVSPTANVAKPIRAVRWEL